MYISIQYATSCSLPHTRTQIVQLPTHSSTFQLSTPLPADPSHSHTKCPTTNTQQYIQFSKSLPADPLTLPHKMSNYQHTAVNFNSLRHFLLTPSHSHTKCPTTNTQQYISIQYATPCWPLTLPHKMSKYQHTAVHTVQYTTPCWTPHTPTQNVQLPTHSSTCNSVRHSMLTPSHSHTKCPTTNTQQYIQFSTPLPAEPLTIPHKMSNCQHTAINKIQYTTSCWTLTLPHKMSNYQHTTVITIQYATPCWPLHTPTQNVQLPTHSSTYNSVRHFLLTPSHSHTICPTTNTQQYIQFSTPHPADPLTLPHKMSNCQHTAVHTIQYATPCWPPHTPTQNVQLPTHSSTFNLSILHRNVLITLFNWVTNY